ncbi:MAG: pyrroline-5-carboxylate reductase [Planctomycetota bacterium]|nr:MAG: pyrroline-5-carboxylate reductase [Planctomycetota bacterium]
MAGKYRVGFIGGGNMAEPMVAAILKEKICSPNETIVSDLLAERRELFEAEFGASVTDNNRQLVANSERIVFSIKPQTFTAVAEEIADVITDEHMLISIMAGVSTGRIAAAFPKVKARVVRVMPNLPIRVGAGVAALCAGENATEHDVAEARAVFDAGGGTIVVNDERLMDAVTAVSGSGPAYFYYFVESIVQGGVACGLSEDDALKLAKYTCLGAGRMMLETDDPPAELRRKVTSKGGTTQAAIEHMNKVGIPEGIRNAVKAAYERGKELGS